MRKLTLFSLFLATMSLAMLSSCSDDDSGSAGSGNNNNNTQKNFLEAKINGTDFSQGTLSIDFDETSKFLEVTANSSDQVTIISLFMNVNGDDSLSVSDINEVSAQLQIGPDLYQGEAGSIVITKNDKTGRILEGTFNYTARNLSNDTKEITAGKFSAKY